MWKKKDVDIEVKNEDIDIQVSPDNNLYITVPGLKHSFLTLVE